MPTSKKAAKKKATKVSKSAELAGVRTTLARTEEQLKNSRQTVQEYSNLYYDQREATENALRERDELKRKLADSEAKLSRAERQIDELKALVASTALSSQELALRLTDAPAAPAAPANPLEALLAAISGR